MKSLYEYCSILSKIGFCSAFISNSFLIYLTVFHIKKIVGTYKIMVIAFAAMGIMFSVMELVAKPYTHNYNKSLVYFSLSSVLVWLLYPVIPGFAYGSYFYLYCQIDNYSDGYVKSEILSNYELAIEEVPRFVIVPYNADDTLRWNNFGFLIQGVSVVGAHYLIIIYFGLKMNFNMKKKLEHFSKTHQRLHQQFFKALVVQTMAPTLLFVLPAGPILLGPLFSPIFDIEISLQTGWLCSVFSLFPPIDSISFMIIVTEYKKVIKSQLNKMVAHGVTVSTTSIGKTPQWS